MNRFRNWANLPSELIDLFTKTLDYPSLLKFSGICSSWRSVSLPIFKTFLESLLIIQNDWYYNGLIWFFNPSTGNPFQIKLPSRFTTGNIRGFSNGWIVLEQHSNLLLLPLFSCAATDNIHLPFLPRESKHVKARFSHDQSMTVAIDYQPPRRSDFILYFCRPKQQDSSWTLIKVPYFQETSFEDVIFSKGKFYAPTTCGVIVVVEASIDGLTTNVMYASRVFCYTYMVDIPRHGLVFVNLSMWPEENLGHWIADYDISGETDSDQAIKYNGCIGDIGDHAVFISCHQTRLISTFDYPYFKKNMDYTTADPIRGWPGELVYCDDKPSALGGRFLDKIPGGRSLN